MFGICVLLVEGKESSHHKISHAVELHILLNLMLVDLQLQTIFWLCCVTGMSSLQELSEDGWSVFTGRDYVTVSEQFMHVVMVGASLYFQSQVLPRTHLTPFFWLFR